jgi:KDO2-lipid IV(A) lauroyltransferase
MLPLPTHGKHFIGHPRRNTCMFIETFKTLTISRKAMLRHCTINPVSQALLDRMAAENRSVILVMGHYGNWEWAGNTFSMLCKQQLFVIYHPLGNKQFDGLMYKMRTRFGTRLIPMKNTFKEMLGNNQQMVSATAFIADQTPSSAANAYWTNFLNQDTAIQKGTEIIARKLNMPILFTSVHRVKQGYYEINVEMLVDDPSKTADGEISEKHTRRLEQDIIAHPEVWLWSHRRWKLKRPE